mmetsp:Transcript_20074/g.48254  ORF Transcript_20074/g.48254 Transcript_20074/m.48254 type:complete len:120 (+) Transcript_20074:201-560(+)
MPLNNIFVAIKPTFPIFLLIVLLRHHQTHAQSTITVDNEGNSSLYGPNDRFTEGTMVESIFREIDLDGDGKLDRHEVTIFFQRRGSEVQDGLWEKEDKNGDGFIELHEFVRGNKDGDEL